MRKVLVVAVVVLVVGGGVLAASESVTLRGTSGPLWAWSDLQARGLNVVELDEADNAAWVYIEAINACRTPTEPVMPGWMRVMTDGVWPAGKDGDVLAAFMTFNDKALELVRRGSRMGACQLPYVGEAGMPLWALNAATLPGMRYMMELLTVRIRQLQASGQIDEAVAETLVLLRVAGHLGKGVTMKEGLLAAAGMQRGVGLLRELALGGRASEVALAEALTELNWPTVDPPSMKHFVECDQAVWVDALEQMFDRPAWLATLWEDRPETDRSDANWQTLYSRMARTVLPDRTARRTMETMYDTLSLRAGQSAREAAWMFPMRHKMLVGNVPIWNIPARRRVVHISQVAAGFDRAHCEYAMVRVVLALELQRLRTGAYPEVLDVVAADLGGSLPPDPYSDEPMLYRREGAGWVLYCVGENYGDDGGRLGDSGENFVKDVVVRHQPVVTSQPADSK